MTVSTCRYKGHRIWLNNLHLSSSISCSCPLHRDPPSLKSSLHRVRIHPGTYSPNTTNNNIRIHLRLRDPRSKYGPSGKHSLSLPCSPIPLTPFSIVALRRMERHLDHVSQGNIPRGEVFEFLASIFQLTGIMQGVHFPDDFHGGELHLEL
jgi:hypothetical protein